MKEILRRGSLQFPFENYKFICKANEFIVCAHWHDEIEIIYILKGSLDLLVDEHMLTLFAGDVYFINSGTMHHMTSSNSGVEYVAYVFPLEYLSFDIEDYSQQQILTPLITKKLLFPNKVNDNFILDKIKKSIMNLVHIDTNRAIGYQLATKIELYTLINILYTEKLFIESTSKSSLTTNKKLMSYLNQYYTEQITLDDISKHINMSPNYFCRYFKSQFGKTFIEYLNYLRIEKACILLATETMPIVDIALEIGYNSISYFNRQFKIIVGTTPKIYRQTKKKTSVL